MMFNGESEVDPKKANKIYKNLFIKCDYKLPKLDDVLFLMPNGYL